MPPQIQPPAITIPNEQPGSNKLTNNVSSVLGKDSTLEIRIAKNNAETQPNDPSTKRFIEDLKRRIRGLEEKKGRSSSEEEKAKIEREINLWMEQLVKAELNKN